jgi:UDP:flavonoid glycosyltransferase YjiC (YdhE family)
MEYLAEAGFQIHVLTSGNGLRFFQDKSVVSSLTPMESFYYSGSNGGVSGWATLKTVKKLSAIAKTKSRQLTALLESVRPDVAVIDSEYALGPLKRRSIPVVAINTSEMVVSNYLKASNRPSGTFSHFWLVEFSDYLFHKHRADLVLCPSPVGNRTRGNKFKRIGLIVRRSVLDIARPISEASYPPPRSLRNVLFMLSGSVHASNISFPESLPFNVDVVGIQGKSSGNVTYHGRQLNNIEFLRRADALVVNGGYSAVSEVFALGKPAFVVPVSGHAEQFVNASLVQDLGLGFIASEADVVNQLLKMYEQNQWVGRKPIPSEFELNGAREAAAMIRSFASRLDPLIAAPPVPAAAVSSH